MGLHRPYIRKGTKEIVEDRAQKNERGQFLDAHTNRPIEGKYDLGHKTGHEFRKEAATAEKEGVSQKEFNERMNNPDLYQIEDPSVNRSHVYEEKNEEAVQQMPEQEAAQRSDQDNMEGEGNGESQSAAESVGEELGMDM